MNTQVNEVNHGKVVEALTAGWWRSVKSWGRGECCILEVRCCGALRWRCAEFYPVTAHWMEARCSGA